MYWKIYKWLLFIVLKSRYSCKIHAVKVQEVCECQDAKLNWLIHTTELWLQHLQNTFAKTVLSTLLHNNRLCLLLSILTNSVWSFRESFFNEIDSNLLNDEFWNFLNDESSETLSTMRFLMFESCIDTKIAETNESRFDEFIDFRYDVTICKTCDREIEELRRSECLFMRWNIDVRSDI